MNNQSINFSISRLPKIEFGSGKLSLLPKITRQFGSKVLLVTGGSFLKKSATWQKIINGFKENDIHCLYFSCENEPSPSLIDDAVKEFFNSEIDIVIAIGGGSALDAGKAIAGLLNVQHSVMDYLEGVGPELEYKGPAVPFIAVPTTAGTGSETTKNAVLSDINQNTGFKKSFRDEQLVAQYAIVDPDFLKSCPPNLIAANGMDALTQLLESYVSLKSNPMTDALALSGLQCVFESLHLCYKSTKENEHARSQLAYGAMLSGITLAQVGLGSVHGLASPLGAFYPIPHGEVCGLLLASATRCNINVLRKLDPQHPALHKYANVGRMLNTQNLLNDVEAQDHLVETLSQWSEDLSMPLLSDYGVQGSHLDHIVKYARGSSMKTNPIVLSDADIRLILKECL